MNPRHIQKILTCKSPSILDKHPILFAYLYGSFTAGAVHPFSDVDIGIYVNGVSESEYLSFSLGISLEFDEALPKNLQSDVRVINNLSLSLLGQIVTDGILIYCRDNAVRIYFETSIRMAYFDFIPVLKIHQNAFAERALSG